ncbi:glycosyltransferase family 4 protein [Myroides odoratimimus]|uniref:Glycosyl transferase family 1 domain-containing protein n=1 Tax=Myroides odoratimimus CIP 101113 TaxID=883154 RepID=A0AAV3F2B5_9FLAO|nr:glycosyltransferase family 4 protein [Myroides odoratimimus]EHO09919.1 hypothetical protein HMPREF9715_02220 [Myroides odoratimimus CIP 101113]
MKILYFYQYFSTPNGSWGTRVYEFAKEWVNEGHEITVVTSVYSKSDLLAKKFVDIQYFDGIKVIIINVNIDNKQGFLKRIVSFLSYSLVASYYALRIKADIVIASSGPITVGIPGLVAKFFRNRKLVFETRDLWPEGAIELGVIKNKILIKLCFWFEKLCYNSSSLIVTLSPGMTDNVKKRFPKSKVIDVTNAANIELFQKDNVYTGKYMSKSYGVYTGNIGEVNNSRWLLETALVLKRMNREDIGIVLIGDGQLKDALLLEAKKCGLSNFTILPLMPKNELIVYLQNAFVSFVPLKGTPVLDTSSPNKFFESLAAGVPIIQNTNGWMKTFLETYNLGFTIDPNDSEALAKMLIKLKDNTSICVDMGERAKKVAAKEFNKNYLSRKMLKYLVEAYEN